ncbi:glutamate--tRNA ligase [Candidatus Uhrbacteria bacterium RIFCSPHIGHO2_01_FULL_63_20]|uniref:Glutamate--tRNA ligase n=1 Tax=Candidatus Uhrbacteria bacterium RIFCSPHIGHO2_01_FULL_63_20 TaxID=1802385 RepID=A0A1F7TKD9_9BACT|nr:MAG: glutamate--tRNA ligase [Candidatus Uhrbacteria bacterium RIFCSPHIGHO2_01_FULL_63_20]
MNTIVTRFPPSPTGYLHIGGLRTALYNWLYARKHGGTFVLRIEDTDRERLVPGAVESLIRALDAVGLDYDEGPVLDSGGKLAEKGTHGPYIQSQRKALHEEHARVLLEKGMAYRCFCSKERLDALRKQQELAKRNTKYDRHCASLSPQEIEQKMSAGEPSVIRLKIPAGKTAFDDAIRGRIEIDTQELDDQVLVKSDGFPTYHLANVVDDHLMEVTHVIRGEEWISSAPKHVILYQAFGWDVPVFAHLPLILNADRSKLSKRQGDVAVEDYLEKGYLPEALVNFVALMGFNPSGDKEIYTREELMNGFDLPKVNKSGAVFNLEKLDWMNGQYIRAKSPAELAALCVPFLERAGKRVDPDLLQKMCSIERERMTKLSDIVEAVDSFLVLSGYEASLLVWKKSDQADALKNLQAIRTRIGSLSENDFAASAMVEGAILKYIEENGLQKGNVLWPLRVALSGRSASPSPFELAWVLGKQETVDRLSRAIALLSA